MPTTLRLKPPEDYLLRRDACSYGYFLLAPNRWDVGRQTLARPLRVPGGVVVVEVSQAARGRRGRAAANGGGAGEGDPLRVACSKALDRAGRAAVERQVTRMLRLDEDAASIAGFHRADPRWRRGGRGRLFRSPTFFEDVIKTVTSCNVQWPGTIQMNRRLCEVLGTRATPAGAPVEAWSFPEARVVARARPAMLRARCRTGYRDERIVELARRLSTSASRGGLDAAWFEDPATPDDAVREALLELPGIGPYAAANIMQLLGRYRTLPLDTESVRHGRAVLGMRGASRRVMERVRRHFAPFGAHAFRSYWFELWAFYEGKHGPAWTWERDSTGKMFTAALLNG